MSTDRLPPLPSLRELTAELRQLNEEWCVRRTVGEVSSGALLLGPPRRACAYGWECIPGAEPFDATAAARRLLAAARNGGAE